MAVRELHVVTGAFGFAGQYIARRLLKQGHRVRTLTGSPDQRNPLSAHLEAHPYNFARPVQLFDSLRGAQVLYNTYWQSFDEPLYNTARENSLRLLETAQRAGVQRVVHLSVTNPELNTPLGYFRAKARVEEALRQSGMSYAILRPALIFGAEDFVINNIAWLLRRVPVFPVLGDGQFKIQPIYVDDLALLALELGAATKQTTLDAIGPQTFTFRQLIADIGETIGHRRPLLSLPPALGLASVRILSQLLGDQLTSGQEMQGLQENRLLTDSLPLGWTRLTEWLEQHRDTVGQRFVGRRLRREPPEMQFVLPERIVSV